MKTVFHLLLVMRDCSVSQYYISFDQVSEKETKFQIGNTKNSFRAMVDAATKKALSGIPLMKTKAGPRDKEVE